MSDLIIMMVVALREWAIQGKISKVRAFFWSFFGSFSIAFITFEVFWQDKAQMSFLETLIMLIAVGLFCGLFSIISLKKETQSPKTPTDT